jgi:glycosyltransferase involved in cell wall biosynthesis
MKATEPTILVNAISIREGGSLVVLRELVGGICQMRPSWKLHVVANSQVANTVGLPNTVSVHSFPSSDQSFWKTRWWYETGLINLVKHLRADVLYSQTNYLPRRRPPCKTLLLEQHAGHFSDVFQKLMLDSLSPAGRFAWRIKSQWVRSSVLRANVLTVQTKCLAKAISKETKIDVDRIHVIPHGSGQSQSQLTMATPPRLGETLRIGYTTRFGVQKNFNVLFAAAARLKSAGHQIKVVLTLCPSLAENQAVLRVADRYGVSDLVENHGDLNALQLSELYRSLHIFVFPSLVESFGFPIIEAMASGLPILLSDTESNREVAGDGGLYFAAHDANQLKQKIISLCADRTRFMERAKASLQRQFQLTWESAVLQNIKLIEKLLRDNS